MWKVTLYGRITGDPYTYEVQMYPQEDLKKVINDACSQHASQMTLFPHLVRDGEFTNRNKFGLEWKDDESSCWT